jgi:hypothetical protein
MDRAKNQRRTRFVCSTGLNLISFINPNNNNNSSSSSSNHNNHNKAFIRQTCLVVLKVPQLEPWEESGLLSLMEILRFL